MSAMAKWVMSIPIQRRFSFCAACTAVPQPQKGSSTTSPSLLDALMMRSKSGIGFCVGYPSRSVALAFTGEISVQTSCKDVPLTSSRYRM